jgi:hypothetical protein
MLSVCLYVYPPTVARQRLGKNVTAETNTHANKRTVGRVFYAVGVVSKECRRIVLPTTYCLLTTLTYSD